jgi:integrase/recombinase XerD
VEGCDGWWGSVARFLVRFCPATGLRPKEVRLQDLTCIDFERQELLVCHPKGEGSWSEPHTQTAPITDDGMLALRDFIDERETFLAGQYHEALIPLRRQDGTLGYWSEGLMRKLKAQIERMSKVKFHLRTFRATFGQMAIDGGSPLDSVSVSLRHSTTRTTEMFYARKQAKTAHADVRSAIAKVAP